MAIELFKLIEINGLSLANANLFIANLKLHKVNYIIAKFLFQIAHHLSTMQRMHFFFIKQIDKNNLESFIIAFQQLLLPYMKHINRNQNLIVYLGL